MVNSLCYLPRIFYPHESLWMKHQFKLHNVIIFTQFLVNLLFITFLPIFDFIQPSWQRRELTYYYSWQGISPTSVKKLFTPFPLPSSTVSVLWREEGNTVKYSLSTSKTLMAEPKEFPKGSSYISPCIPTYNTDHSKSNTSSIILPEW